MAEYFNAIASTYLYGYVLVTDSYPDTAAKPLQGIPDGAFVVILSTNDAEQYRLGPYFALHHVTGTVVGHRRLATDAGPLDLTFVRVPKAPPAK
jgi:hypothetical protein